MSTVFGGSKSKSTAVQQSQSQSDSTNTSYNQAYPQIQQDYQPVVQQGTGATDYISQLLGLKGGDAAQQGFNQYKDSTGYNFIRDQGINAIDQSAASRGTLNSGSTMKELDKYGTGLASQYYGNYLDKLFNLSGQGMQAGGLISGAGNYSLGKSSATSSSTGNSNSNSSSKPGLMAQAGQAAQMAAMAG